jgi:hypothetical protein
MARSPDYPPSPDDPCRFCWIIKGDLTAHLPRIATQCLSQVGQRGEKIEE